MSEPETSSQQQKPIDLSEIRWKMLVACDVCRRRKVRCDGERPCLRCSKDSKECTFSTPRRLVLHPEKGISLKRQRSSSPSPNNRSKKQSVSNLLSPEVTSASGTSSVSVVTGKPRLDKLHNSAKAAKEQHLLLIDSDDQIVYSGPSTGMPLFARLGLLHTVEVSESEKNVASFVSHTASALGITSASTSSGDFFNICLQHCPQALMFNLIGYHLKTPIFFPLLHAPSFLAEFVAVTQRRITCSPQYGALLMSILAVTAHLVESAKALLPSAERDQAGENYYEIAQDLLRICKNKLDIRYILALYRNLSDLLSHSMLIRSADLALFSEGRNGSTSSVSSFVSEAVGLAFATGLHRSTREFKMDPVTLQIRTRLFWALYTLDTALSYSQGRPPLIRLSECSVDLPVIVDNEYIKKTEILAQPEDDPPVAMAAAVKMIEIYIITEQVLSAINIPARTPAAAFSLNNPLLDRGELFKRAQERLLKIEEDLPVYLSHEVTPDQAPYFFHSSRVRTTLQFVRTIIARQALIEDLETCPTSEKQTSSATSEACRLSVDTVKTYSHLRHLGFLRFCGFHAVTHVTAAAHTLIACMFRSSTLAFEYRPYLLTAIDVLLVFSSPFPYVETVAQQLVQLSRTLDYKHGSNTQSEGVGIRVLARRIARSSSKIDPILSTQSWKHESSQSFNIEPFLGQDTGAGPSNASLNYHQLLYSDDPLHATHSDDTLNPTTNSDEFAWPTVQSAESVAPQYIYNASDDSVWEDSFSFLNDGLFSKL